VVWSAPAFLAEVLLDALASVGLYRRLCKLESRHWLATVLLVSVERRARLVEVFTRSLEQDRFALPPGRKRWQQAFPDHGCLPKEPP